MEVTFKGGLGELEGANALSSKTIIPLSFQGEGDKEGGVNKNKGTLTIG
jgi:hypothetical protein